MKKVILLDRDGTIIKDYEDEVWSNISEIELLDGALEGLDLFAKMGYEFIIVTNQYLIGDGYISKKQYDIINNQVKKFFIDNKLPLLHVFYCPHKTIEPCECRKPNNAMFIEALSHYDIDTNTAVMIGDSDADYGFACNSNIEFFGLTSKNLSVVKGYNNLFEIANIIYNNNN